MRLNLAFSVSLSLIPHIAKSRSWYVLCSMMSGGFAVPIANTHAGPSACCTNLTCGTWVA